MSKVATYKEIVTKAVIGKGKKYFKNSYSLKPADKPSNVLGCWVINHQFRGYKSGENVGVDGSFDVNIWYSYENDSKTTVVNKKIEYNEAFHVKTKENTSLTGDTDIIVRSLKQPTCSNVQIDNDGTIHFDIEKELGVELVGETKVKIAIEDDEEPWEEIEDEPTEEVMQEIDNQVNENYIEENTNE